MDIDKLRELCMAKPGATEELQWDVHLLYKVGGKIFCIGSIEPGEGASMKVDEENFDELTSKPGIKQAGHMAKRKWIYVAADARINIKEWKQLIDDSYELIKSKLPKKVQATL